MDNEAEYQQKYQTYSDIIELAGQQKKLAEPYLQTSRSHKL